MSKSKKHLLILVGCIALIVASLCACAGFDPTPQSGNQATSSRSSTSGGISESLCNNVQYKEACQEVVRRYQFLNNADKYGYFYGFVQGVQSPVIEYIVQGGVFPADDLISNPNYQEACNGYTSSTACAVVLDKQQPDGTYGTNGNAMFGFRADGAYFEWSGPYAYSETPLHFEGVKTVGCKSGAKIEGC